MTQHCKSISLLGDSLQLLSQFEDNCFDACIVDPPYNMSKKKGLSWAFSSHVTMQEIWDRFSDEDYFNFSYQWLKEITRITKPNGNLFVFGTFHNIYTLGFLVQCMQRKILNSIIWMKPNAQPNITCRTLTESSEQLIWICNNKGGKATKWCFNYWTAKELNNGKQMRNVWEMPLTPRRERVAGHPSQKPEQLIRRLVLIATQPGDWIMDPFAGVGTTGIVALRENRNVFMIEKESCYLEAQKKRFEQTKLKGKALFPSASNFKKHLKKMGLSKGKRRSSNLDASNSI